MAKRAILLAILLGCTRAAEPPPPPPPPENCLNRQLAAKGLNQFGDPPDTNYPGGTPLFDEKSGKRTDRAEYIFSRHPDIARACASSDAGA